MPRVPVKPLSQVPPGSIAEFETPTALYAICNVGGVIHALDGTCPHAGGPLTQGALHGATVVCPWHAWEFNVRTGACEEDETCVLKTYPTAIEDGQIFMELP